MIHTLLLVVHILVCVSLMISILLQSGKGGNMAAAFGVGGGSQTLFGGRGASTFITRATQILGAAFFVTSLSLAFMSRGTARQPRSLIQQEAKTRGATAGQTPPASPGAAAPAPAGAPAQGSGPAGAPARQPQQPRPTPAPTTPGGR